MRSAVAGGPCSYDKVIVNLSMLCMAPDATPLSDVQAKFLNPAIKRQLADLQQRMTKTGNLRPWTAFQVQHWHAAVCAFSSSLVKTIVCCISCNCHKSYLIVLPCHIAKTLRLLAQHLQLCLQTQGLMITPTDYVCSLSSAFQAHVMHLSLQTAVMKTKVCLTVQMQPPGWPHSPSCTSSAKAPTCKHGVPLSCPSLQICSFLYSCRLADSSNQHVGLSTVQVQPPGWPHPLTLMYPLGKTPTSSQTPSKGQAAAQQPALEEEEELKSIRYISSLRCAS